MRAIPRVVPRATNVLVVALVVAALGIATVACSPADSSDEGTRDGGDAPVTVATSFYPVAAAAEAIGGDCVDVVNLTPPGVEPHDLELTPDDVEAIASSDVVLYLGSGFQPAVEDAIGDAQGSTLDVLTVRRDRPATSIRSGGGSRGGSTRVARPGFVGHGDATRRGGVHRDRPRCSV